MRTLATEVAGIPVGTPYDILEDGGLVRARWMVGPLLRQPASGNVHNTQPSAPRARDLYAAHLAAVGIDDADEAPCGNCGQVIRAALTVCPECGADPDADVPCSACDKDGVGEPSGYHFAEGFWLERICGICSGERKVEAPNAGQREAAIKAAREWRRAQKAEVNPAPAGIGASGLSSDLGELRSRRVLALQVVEHGKPGACLRCDLLEVDTEDAAAMQAVLSRSRF